ncbi:hypothetical protein ANCDUO_05763 [Ancylostoma duodenale]|uniref:Uncharacterized protein n=1 Tax=Ancylostoma duodenale TaxID=51022 RepID=A0A0C2H3E0_9BILA|nr:hypothetical protein ANCDUO_05763 [Ancylostoma duodenale]
MGLKSEKLRPFWLSLSQEEKQQDLYAIVNDLPNIVVIGHDGDKEKLEVVWSLVRIEVTA